MQKIVSKLYEATRKLGKLASLANDVSHIQKSIVTKDPSHIAKRLVRKTATKSMYKTTGKISRKVNKKIR